MANLKSTTHEGMRKLLASRSPRVIGNNTTIEPGNHGTDINVRLHGHHIATMHEDGAVSITDAGWPTVTTRDRLNQLLPQRWRVTQKDWEQYITDARDGFSLTPWDGEWITLSHEYMGETAR